jgi:hypothetical protein
LDHQFDDVVGRFGYKTHCDTKTTMHRGTAEQNIKEGKKAIRWRRLSCRKFRKNEIRLQLHALA